MGLSIFQLIIQVNVFKLNKENDNLLVLYLIKYPVNFLHNICGIFLIFIYIVLHFVRPYDNSQFYS